MWFLNLLDSFHIQNPIEASLVGICLGMALMVILGNIAWPIEFLIKLIIKKKIFSTNIIVKSFHVTSYSYQNPKRSGYCDKQERIQRLVKQFKVFKLIYFEKILDEEIVPAHVWIGYGALGFDSTGWKSKFQEYIR